MTDGGQVLDEGMRSSLLELARRSLTEYVTAGTTVGVEPAEGVLGEAGAAFVTLKRAGQLRGCIGNLARSSPLNEVVRDMAIRAGTGDPRFRPVEPDELSELRLEISVLTRPVDVDGPDDVHVGEHGVILERGPYRGLLLPQVATEHGWDAPELVRHVCRKAGLPTDAWQLPDAQLSVFSAIVFGEPRD